MLEKKYSIVSSPEPPMDWDSYEKIVVSEFEAKLASTPTPSERDMQELFERHPSLVPGAFTASGRESGHYPWLCGVFSQPPLPSYDRRIPDFMWISTNSDTEEAVFVEIEAPGKHWFNKSGRPTQFLTQAKDQISEWKAWFDVAHNVAAFKAFYGTDQIAREGRRFRRSYILIYGRRSEFNGRSELTAKRSHMVADDVVMMTYDRLFPNPKAKEMICIRAGVSRRLTALNVPPTITWQPGLANKRARICGLESAIDKNPYMSDRRKKFLIERLPYWNKWARETEMGLINGGDYE